VEAVRVEHDALIVGAGVAGLSAARALLDHGASVVVVDRAAGGGVTGEGGPTTSEGGHSWL